MVTTGVFYILGQSIWLPSSIQNASCQSCDEYKLTYTGLQQKHVDGKTVDNFRQNE